MSYGHHHARSSDALVWLVTHPVHVSAAELHVVLTCRAALLAAHRERCRRATHGANVHSALFKDRKDARDLAGVAQGGAVALSQLLDEYPAFETHTARFTDVLQDDTLSPYSQAWVAAAKHAVLATETAVSSPAWTQDPGQAWTIMADIADAAETLTVVDRALEPSVREAVPDWETAVRVPSAELRLVARHIGYVARAGELDPATDTIVRREVRGRPVQLHRSEDLVFGVRAADDLLRRSELSVPELRSFALMQSDIANTCAELADSLGLSRLRESFRRRDERFRELAGATVRLASIGPSSGRPLLAQTQDIGRVLLEARRAGARIKPGVLADFDAEHPSLATSLAGNVSRALASGRLLVVDDGDVALRWRRAEPGERPEVSRVVGKMAQPPAARSASGDIDFVARRIANAETERELGGVAVSANRSRQTLRASLDRQPYGCRPLTPNRRPSRRL
ncbi:MAG: hypothetical protein ACOYX5_16120 [Actinomycetota bacterium]